VRAGEDGSVALLFASLAVFDDIVRREDCDIRMRQERHVYADTCGRNNKENDIVSAMQDNSSSGSSNFLRQNAELSHQSARLDVLPSPPAAGYSCRPKFSSASGGVCSTFLNYIAPPLPYILYIHP
jgi:hypothetical protein